MPVKIATDLLMSWEFETLTGEWMPQFGFTYALLTKAVELEEGLTLHELFKLIESEPRLRHFVEGYFNCDIDALASTPPDSLNDPATVYAYVPTLSGYKLVKTLEADYLRVSQFCYLEGEEASLGYTIKMCSNQLGSLSRPVAKTSFQTVMHLPIVLDRVFTVFYQGDSIERNKHFTMLEFLESVFYTLIGADSPQWEEDEIDAVGTNYGRLKKWLAANIIGGSGDDNGGSCQVS